MNVGGSRTRICFFGITHLYFLWQSVDSAIHFVIRNYLVTFRKTVTMISTAREHSFES
jgi:hypothetical protein